MFKRLLGGEPKEAQFWRWFVENSGTIATSSDMEGPVFERLTEQLRAVNPGLVWELGSEGPGHEIVISADGIREIFPIVERVVAAAPRIPGWKVTAFRPRKSLDGFTIEMDGIRVDPREIRFELDLGDEGRADLSLYVPGYREGEERIMRATYILLDAALGERDVETRIGAIDFFPMNPSENGPPRPSLLELASTLDSKFPR